MENWLIFLYRENQTIQGIVAAKKVSDQNLEIFACQITQAIQYDLIHSALLVALANEGQMMRRDYLLYFNDFAQQPAVRALKFRSLGQYLYGTKTL